MTVGIPFDQIAIQTVNGLVNGLRAARGGLTNGLTNGNGFTNGLGSNTSIQDSYNLGWKLAAKFEGWGSDELLASYSPERNPDEYLNGDLKASLGNLLRNTLLN